MNINNTGGPAFPSEEVVDAPYNGHNNSKEIIKHPGMTLRDYFAAKAMQSFLLKSNEHNGVMGVNGYEHYLSKDAYKLADAMLEARKVK